MRIGVARRKAVSVKVRCEGQLHSAVVGCDGGVIPKEVPQGQMTSLLHAAVLTDMDMVSMRPLRGPMKERVVYVIGVR